MEKRCDYLIIGSGVAGYNALKELLTLRPKAKIVMITSDRYYPYDRPPLSKDYLKGKIDKEMLFFEPEDFYKRDNLEVILKKKVEKIDTEDKVAILEDGDNISFNKALIATGGSPRKLGINGENLRGVHYLRTLDDADGIKSEISKGKNAVIIGGGFIGIEVASSLTMLGVRTTVIEVMPYIWSTFVDEKISNFIQKYFETKGVQFILNESVKEIEGDERVKAVVLNSGKKLNADFVVIAVGIKPNVEIAQQSGINVNNGIVVNEYLQTNHPDIYAAGDVANILDPISGKRRRIEHWNNAEYSGKLAARNMLGRNESYNFISSIWSDIFDLHIESAGDTRDYDEYIIRGKFQLEKPKFSVIYIKGGVVKGYLAINRNVKELVSLNKLVQKGVNVSNKRDMLVDENFDLQKLLT
ncbi:MAG: FAD/NAD(P)-binding oxidoreductase [Sulfolobaceae archaeon]|nr:FAD/NAD(P)-binding oxidoreductase [Sulfolobaceae archaeon]